MADVKTQVMPQDPAPWDQAALTKEQAANRDVQRQKLFTQRDAALKDFNSQKAQLRSDMMDGKLGNQNNWDVQQRYTQELKTLEDAYNTQVVGFNNQITALDKADQGLMPDGSPIRPEYKNLLDPKTGLMLPQYQLQVGQYTAQNVDPNSLEGLNAFKKEALRTGPSTYAQLMLQQNLANKNANVDKAAAQANSAAAQARGNIAMRGGSQSGTRAILALQNSRDLMNAKQGVNRDYNTANLQTLGEDEKNRLALLQQLPGMETNLAEFNTNQANQGRQFNITNQAKANEYNITNALSQKTMQDTQNLEVYKEQLKKWSAEKQADATANSGGGGGSGPCCFIFLEARYGNGTMDKVVRRFRDEHMNRRNVRGYHRLSEVLIPVMRKSKIAKFLVRAFMTDPMVSYGKWYYGENHHGFIFKPIAKFWLNTFDYLGLDHCYIRENGEVV